MLTETEQGIFDILKVSLVRSLGNSGAVDAARELAKAGYRLTAEGSPGGERAPIASAVVHCPACGQHVEFKFGAPYVPAATPRRQPAPENCPKCGAKWNSDGFTKSESQSHCPDDACPAIPGGRGLPSEEEIADALIGEGTGKHRERLEAAKAIRALLLGGDK